MSGWISVDDKLPELDALVLVRFASGYDGSDLYAFGGLLDEDEGAMWGVTDRHPAVRPRETAPRNDVICDDDYRVTHWMPLPAPPDLSPPIGLTQPEDKRDG